MKKMRIGVKIAFFGALLCSAAIFVSMAALNYTIPQSYKICRYEDFKLSTKIPVTAETSQQSDTRYSAQLKLFGVIPYQTVDIEIVDKNKVAVLGQPFGMRIYTDGVLVVETSSVTTLSGKEKPSKDAGIEVGDYIRTVDGKSISTNEELSELVEKSGGKTMKIVIKRDTKVFTVKAKPVKDKQNGIYRLGIWVRDSSAGVGTLTFYSPSTGIICGLGHGICDSDTEEILKISSGQIVSADIISVQKGKSGEPGELKGRFTSSILGEIQLNSERGVYSAATTDIKTENLIEIALKQDIKDGEAQILCTIDGEKPKLYSCTVKKHAKGLFSSEENLSVTVTDKTLLSETGGIVQGMSGSPILQNGKLIGAITHVLVDDPTTGYAIFAENMLETAQSVASENKLKDAS